MAAKRYSIVAVGVDAGVAIARVKEAGGVDIVESPRTGIVFAALEDAQVEKLKAMGFSASEVGQVRAPQISAPIAPPAPIPGEIGHTPTELLTALGFSEEWRQLIEPPLSGEGVTIAIIDTGIRESHELIGGRVVYSQNFTPDPMRDGFDHGTGVASIVVNVLPKVSILNMKALNDEGEGSEEAVVMAIDKCIDLSDTDPDIAPMVINMSLGAPDDGNVNNPVRVACRAAIAQNIFVVAAAGNSGPNPGTITLPACERYVVACGAMGYDATAPKYPFIVSQFSSRGPTREGIIKPDAVMFGENITMASSKSDTDTVVKSGTSFAAPFASCVILVHREFIMKRAVFLEPVWPTTQPFEAPLTPQDLLDKWAGMICMKPDFSGSAKDNAYGFGIPAPELLAHFFKAPAAAGISIEQLIVPVFTFGMVTTMMSSVMKEIS